MCDLRRAFAVLRSSDSLTVLQASVLFETHHRRATDIEVLSNTIGVTPNSVTAIARKLRAIGLMAGRQKFVHLTERGVRVCEQAIAAAAAGEAP